MTENEFDRTARAWLEEGPVQLSDRVLQAALDEIHVTRQRRAWWPARRLSPMNTAMKVAIAAAAVVVLAIAGFNLLPGGGPGGTVPTPSPTLTSTPSPSPASFGSHAFGALEPGTYVLDTVQPFRITFSVPAGWEKLIAPSTIWAAPGSDARLGFMSVDNVFVDPCQPDLGLMDPPVGPTVDDLVTALGGVAGLEAATPADISVGGFAGKRVDLSVIGTVDPCPAVETAFLRGNAGTLDVPAPGLDDDYRLLIIDVDGQRLAMPQVARTAATAANRAELQAIVDSIEIESTAPSANPSP